MKASRLTGHELNEIPVLGGETSSFKVGDGELAEAILDQLGDRSLTESTSHLGQSIVEQVELDELLVES